MRIILSPTKQMKREEELHFSLSEPVFIEKTKILREYLKGLPYEDLKASIEDYRKAQDAIEAMTEGTKEWRDALIEANQQVLEILNKYPELAEYVENVKEGK